MEKHLIVEEISSLQPRHVFWCAVLEALKSDTVAQEPNTLFNTDFRKSFILRSDRWSVLHGSMSKYILGLSQIFEREDLLKFNVILIR